MESREKKQVQWNERFSSSQGSRGGRRVGGRLQHHLHHRYTQHKSAPVPVLHRPDPGQAGSPRCFSKKTQGAPSLLPLTSSGLLNSARSTQPPKVVCRSNYDSRKARNRWPAVRLVSDDQNSGIGKPFLMRVCNLARLVRPSCQYKKCFTKRNLAASSLSWPIK